MANQTRSSGFVSQQRSTVRTERTPSLMRESPRLGLTSVRETARRRLPRIVVPLLDAAAIAAALAALEWRTPIAAAYGALTWLMVGGVHRGADNVSPQVAYLVPRLGMRMAAVVPALAIPASMTGQARSLLLAATATLPAVMLARAVAFGVVRATRRRRMVMQRTLIVGTDEVACHIGDVLLEHPEYGLAPVGFVGARPDASLPLPCLGGATELPKVARSHGVERVIIAFGSVDDRELVSVLRTCDDLGADVLLVPRFYELGLAPDPEMTDNLWGYPIVQLRLGRLRGWRYRVKRVFDVVGAAVLLVLTSPVLAAAAVAVRASSPGPILFRQSRVGERGRPFDILKFRTMVVNDGCDTDWSVASDPRVTRVGSILRRTSIDELPQLFNVVRGDMSLVGPRPERPFFAERFSGQIRGYAERHRVPPGITGWAQVHGLRGDTSVETRARFDNGYIDGWSFFTDAVILGRTVGEVVRNVARRQT